MNYLFQICCALSVGLFIGFLGGAVKVGVRRRSGKARPYSADQVERTARLLRAASAVLKFVTVLFLALGLIWCAYYLILGAVEPEQAEYATAMSQLIVSVLTIVSIGFAFFEFVQSSRRREDAKTTATAPAEAAEVEGEKRS